jgi:hypothetical protein
MEFIKITLKVDIKTKKFFNDYWEGGQITICRSIPSFFREENYPHTGLIILLII